MFLVFLFFLLAPRVCQNVDLGEVTDAENRSCVNYKRKFCSKFDDDDFTASAMCCICDGGQNVEDEKDGDRLF